MDFLAWFWAVILGACLVWYSTITIYIAFRGAKDIKQMLRRLSTSESGSVFEAKGSKKE